MDWFDKKKLETTFFQESSMYSINVVESFQNTVEKIEEILK